MIYRAIDRCRICGNKDLRLVLDLGRLSLTSVFPSGQDRPVAKAPLELVKCYARNTDSVCGLVQLRHGFDLKRIYSSSYGYRSGLNKRMIRHLKDISQLARKIVRLNEGDAVLDIGSNDGTLLNHFYASGLRLFGVDPLIKKFSAFYHPGIIQIGDFFSAEKIFRYVKSDKFKVIFSVAMFYDLLRPLEFMQEIERLLCDDGIWVFEQSYLPAMLSQTAYDTICHEHLEYYALRQIKWMADRAGLKIIDIRFDDINGGSFCAVVGRKSSPFAECTQRIERLLQEEKALGLGRLAIYQRFARKMRAHQKKLKTVVRSLRKQGYTIWGMGASTKGNVLLQACGFGPRDLACITEINPDKFGRLTPGTRIPIVAESEVAHLGPDCFLVLPWQFKHDFLFKNKSRLRSRTKFIFPLPKVEEVGNR